MAIAVALWYVTRVLRVVCAPQRLMALRSLAVIPGDPTVINPPSDVRITNIALGDELEDASGRTTLKLSYRPAGAGEDSDSEDEDEDEDEADKSEDAPTIETTVLGSLTPGKVCIAYTRLRTS